MFRRGLQRNVPVGLRSLVTHEAKARSCSSRPRRLQLLRQGETEPPSAQTRSILTFPHCAGLSKRGWSPGGLVSWAEGGVQVGCCSSATAQAALQAPCICWVLPTSSVQAHHLAPCKGMLPRATLRE